jgi:predicted nucleotidyltransferase
MIEKVKSMDLQVLLKQNRENILEIAARHGAYDVRVFGSVARGEADEKSDIDILVSFEPGRSLFDHAGLMLDLEALLGCKVDVVSDKGLRPRLRERVLKDSVAI